MSSHRILGGVLLIAGTTIGGAVVALPITTGVSGFFPALAAFLICWTYLTYSAFLFLEANLWIEGETNLISMAEHTLGRPGKLLGWTAYLFLLVALTTAYMAVSGPFFIDVAETLLGIDLPNWIGPIPFLLVAAAMLMQGTKSVDLVNRVLMIGLGISFFCLLLLIVPSMDVDRLAVANWKKMPLSLSFIITAFGFHIVIPSLTTYMKGDLHSIKRAIFLGSLIPLVLYIVWELVTLAILPFEGQWGILMSAQNDVPATRALSKLLNEPAIVLSARVFELTAVLTSFVGVSLSLMDCLSDALKVQKKNSGRILLTTLTLVPPYIFCLLSPSLFFQALGLAGGFGVSILLGLLPALMVWAGRYSHGFDGPYRAPGGRKALLTVILVSLFIVGNEIWIKM